MLTKQELKDFRAYLLDLTVTELLYQYRQVCQVPMSDSDRQEMDLLCGVLQEKAGEKPILD